MMSAGFIEYVVSAVLVIVTIALLAWFIGGRRARSEWRMTSMLIKAGVDPEVIDSEDHIALINTIRRRCRRCQAEDVCERWLAGRYPGTASFCPNEQVINALKRRIRKSARNQAGIGTAA